VFHLAGKLFPIGGPVTEEDIVDREAFITTLEMRLAGGQSIVLVGPRRTGKTSLAHEVLRRLKKRGFYTATVDCFRLSSRRDLAQALIDEHVLNVVEFWWRPLSRFLSCFHPPGSLWSSNDFQQSRG